MKNPTFFATLMLMLQPDAQGKKPEWMRVHPACGALDVSPCTLYRWIRSGKVRGIRPGHRWLVARDDVERLMSSTKTA